MVQRVLDVFKLYLMRKIILIICLSSIGLNLFSQERYPMPEVDSFPFNNYFEMHRFNPPPPLANGKGIMGLCWVKFKPSLSGKAESITFSPKTDKHLQKEILRLFNAANAKWPVKGYESNEKVEKWLVLPIRYEFLTANGITEVLIESEKINEFFSPTDSTKEQQYHFLPSAKMSSNPFQNPQQRNFELMKKNQTTKIPK